MTLNESKLPVDIVQRKKSDENHANFLGKVRELHCKMLLFFESGSCFSVLLLTFKEAHCLLYRFVIACWFYLDNYSFVDRQSSASGHYTIDFKKHNKR